jgi:3-methyladenine DNA glycosylase AlkD
MADPAQILAQLRALGSIEARTALAKHGAEGAMFGVRFADIDQLAKHHRNDHALAVSLWASDNVDAQILAMKIADPAQMSGKELDRWLGQIRWYMGVDVFVAALVTRSPLAQARADAWRKSKHELRGRAGWGLVAHLARDPERDEAWLLGCLDGIRKGIRSAPNRKREAMNSALIAIGGYRKGLRERALAVADQIGEVEIDHGETHCQTPPARPYIEAMATRTSSKRASKKKVAGEKVAANKKSTAKKSR